MTDKLQAIKERWINIGEKLSDPDTMKDMSQYAKLSKEYKDLEEVVKAYEVWVNIESNIAENRKIIASEEDNELVAMAREEMELLSTKKDDLEQELKEMLLPKDPADERNVILEIRAGTGGDEAGIFAGDLFKMYMRYCDSMNWSTEVISSNESSSGGYKEIVAEIQGQDVYGQLKYESGVHRVQRVPATESQGRVHTSAATVAVLPEAEEVDVEINPADLRIDTFRASGAGGQHVNKTESAVRIVHNPTNTVVECQEGRSQIKNKEIAMKMLRTRLYEKTMQEHFDKIASQRKTLVSTGDRSAKIRTYNYPQGRVTDHRINLTLYNLDNIINGDIQEIINALKVAENAEKMKAGTA